MNPEQRQIHRGPLQEKTSLPDLAQTHLWVSTEDRQSYVSLGAASPKEYSEFYNSQLSHPPPAVNLDLCLAGFDMFYTGPHEPPACRLLFKSYADQLKMVMLLEDICGSAPEHLERLHQGYISLFLPQTGIDNLRPRVHVATFYSEQCCFDGIMSLFNSALTEFKRAGYFEGQREIEVIAEPFSITRGFTPKFVNQMASAIGTEWLTDGREPFFPGYTAWDQNNNRFKRPHFYRQ